MCKILLYSYDFHERSIQRRAVMNLLMGRRGRWMTSRWLLLPEIMILKTVCVPRLTAWAKTQNRIPSGLEYKTG